jgi:hypothetical protein
MKLEFSRLIFEKYLNIKFRENPFDGKRVVPWHNEADSCFQNFAKGAKIIFVF